MHQILSVAGFKRPTSKGRVGGGEKVREGRGQKGRKDNVEFHQILLSNLTTGLTRHYYAL